MSYRGAASAQRSSARQFQRLCSVALYPSLPLHHSDVSKGRILLPRAAVEANLSFAIGKAHSLIARDHQQQTWEFTLQSWANGGSRGALQREGGVEGARLRVACKWHELGRLELITD